MLNGTQGDIIILRYKTQNRNRMTKSKTKREIPEICMNCKFADSIIDYIADTELMVCKKTNKVHNWEYSCKKWKLQE